MSESYPEVASLAHDCLLLDACCLIDLHASGCMTEILAALPCSVAVARYVLQHEALSLRALGNPPATSESPMGGEVVLPGSAEIPFVVVDLISEAEESAFVDFAAAFGDDGEAYTCAIAVSRHWAVATTDRKVISLLQAEFATIAILETPDLLKHWADSATPPQELIRRAVRNIQERARYRPRQRHPLFAWWQMQLVD